MSADDELSMGEAAPVAKPDEVADVELSLSEAELDEVVAKRDLDRAAADFDLKAWIEGVRSARTTVRLYSRPDLDERIQVIGAQIVEAMNLGERHRIPALKDKSKALMREFVASSLDIVLEERSREWQARKTAELKAAGVQGERAITLGLVAAQIVDPEGAFTGEDLAGLAEVIPSQVNHLVASWGKLSGQSDGKGLPTF